MASFLQGVKNFFFRPSNEGKDSQEQEEHTSGHRESGHKRSRQSARQLATPVLQDVGYSCSGGVQGLGWYTASLQVDSDGDAAHAFYQEPVSDSSSQDSSLQQVQATKQASRHHCRLKAVQQGHVVVSGAS